MVLLLLDILSELTFAQKTCGSQLTPASLDFVVNALNVTDVDIW